MSCAWFLLFRSLNFEGLNCKYKGLPLERKMSTVAPQRALFLSLPLNAGSVEWCSFLKKLFSHLKSLKSSDSCDSQEFTSILNQFIEANLLNVSDGDVPIYIACCVAEMFRSAAPYRPVENSSQLEDVLYFFIQVIGKPPLQLEEDSSYLHMLQTLVEVNIFSLAERKCVSNLLRGFIDSSCNAVQKNSDENLYSLLIQVSHGLFDFECEIEYNVLDMLFYHLVPPQRINSPQSFRMARELIRIHRATLERPMLKLLNAGISRNVLPDCKLVSEKKLGDIIKELHDLLPEFTLMILPELLPSLCSSTENIRCGTTHLFGLLFASRHYNLAEKLPELWRVFISKSNDLKERIRIACIHALGDISLHHPTLRVEINDLIAAKTHDSSADVRLCAVSVIQYLMKHDSNLINQTLLTCMTERVVDVKVDVRHFAIRTLCILFKKLNEASSQGECNEFALDIFKSVLNFYWKSPAFDKELIEKHFVRNLISFKIDVTKRMQILADASCYMGSKNISEFNSAFKELFTRFVTYRKLLSDVFHAAVEGKDISDRLDDLIQTSSEQNLQNSKKMVPSYKFALSEIVKNEKLTEYMKCFIGEHHIACQQMKPMMEEVSKKMYSLSKDCFDAFGVILSRCSLLLVFDQDSIGVLFDIFSCRLHKAIRNSTARNEYPLVKLLVLLADTFAYLFATDRIMTRLINLFDIEVPFVVESVVMIIKCVLGNLNSIGAIPNQLKLKIIEYCVNVSIGGYPRASKYAVQCICNIFSGEELIEELRKIVKKYVAMDASSYYFREWFSASHGWLPCYAGYKALDECVKRFPDSFFDEVVNFLEDSVLPKLVAVGPDSGDISVYDSAFLDTIIKFEQHRCKAPGSLKNFAIGTIFAMKLASNLLLRANSLTPELTSNLARQVIKSLVSIAKSNIYVDAPKRFEDDCALSRCIAGCCILKLATNRKYARFIAAETLIHLSFLIRDEVKVVRLEFVRRLWKYLFQMRLPSTYLGLIPLLTLTDDSSLKETINSRILLYVSRRRKYLKQIEESKPMPVNQNVKYSPEYACTTLIYLLAHQPDYKIYNDEKCLESYRECVWTMLRCFETQNETDSFEYLYAIFTKLKRCEDATLSRKTKEDKRKHNLKIWALCDLSMLLISYRVTFISRASTLDIPTDENFFVLREDKDPDCVYIPDSLIKNEQKKRPVRNKKKAYMDASQIQRAKKMSGSGMSSLPGRRLLVKKKEISESSDRVNIRSAVEAIGRGGRALGSRCTVKKRAVKR